jgi:hypothetical protein
LPSAKALPSAALDKEYMTKNSSAKTYLPRVFYQAVPRQLSANKSCRDEANNVNGYFVECPTAGHSVKKFFLKILCRVPLCMALGKEFFFFENSLPFFENSLPSGPLRGTRQRIFF